MRDFRKMLFGGMAAACGLAGAQESEVIFFDDFNGPLDTSIWQAQLGTGSQYNLTGWGNNELQYYRAENAWTEDGDLVIEARRENFGGRQYTSARLRTLGSFDFQYGTVEASIKLPSNPGIWPAFWMLPTNSPYGGWPRSGEIDIMESFNFADTASGTLHYGDPHTFRGGEIGGIDFVNGFNVFRVDWEPNQIRWYVNDQLFYTRNSNQWFSSSDPDNPRAPFDSPFHMLLNVAVGGNPVSDPNPADFPQRMEVEWVRVSRPAQSPFGFFASGIPGTIEAEDFDRGYNGQSYFDTSAGNEYGAYRTDVDVDIEASSDGGFNIGAIEPNEYLEYTVFVQQAGRYLVEASVASETSGSKFRLEFDGVDKTGDVLTPITGGWQDYVVVSTEVELDAGEQVMRFQHPNSFFSTPFNLSWFRFTKLADACPADINNDGVLTGADFNAFLTAFSAMDPLADQNSDGTFTGADFNAFLTNFSAGCD